MNEDTDMEGRREKIRIADLICVGQMRISRRRRRKGGRRRNEITSNLNEMCILLH